MRHVLMHVSDLHAGRPFNNDVAAQLAKEAHALKPDLLVVSGDMVQRADFVVQWQVITSYLRHLPEPKLIIPGNHDVPLFNVFNRLFRPYARYQKYISTNLNPVFELPGLAVVGGCSAHGLTIDGGKVSKAQLAQMEQAFARYPSDVCKVAVLHHHVVAPPGSEDRRMISNAQEVAAMLDRSGVDLMLCGHIHVSYVGRTRDVWPELERGTIICQSGTSTSRRGKGREAGRNSYNVIEIDDASIRIAQHLYDEGERCFVPVANHVFPRRTAGVYMLPREQRAAQG